MIRQETPEQLAAMEAIAQASTAEEVRAIAQAYFDAEAGKLPTCTNCHRRPAIQRLDGPDQHHLCEHCFTIYQRARRAGGGGLIPVWRMLESPIESLVAHAGAQVAYRIVWLDGVRPSSGGAMFPGRNWGVVGNISAVGLSIPTLAFSYGLDLEKDSHVRRYIALETRWEFMSGCCGPRHAIPPLD